MPAGNLERNNIINLFEIFLLKTNFYGGKNSLNRQRTNLCGLAFYPGFFYS